MTQHEQRKRAGIYVVKTGYTAQGNVVVKVGKCTHQDKEYRHKTSNPWEYKELRFFDVPRGSERKAEREFLALLLALPEGIENWGECFRMAPGLLPKFLSLADKAIAKIL